LIAHGIANYDADAPNFARSLIEDTAMDLELTGKVAIVGGGSSGIGYAIARRLAQEGARVLIWARGKDALEAAARRIRDETGGEVAVASADIAKPADNLRVVDAAVDAFGRLDILVNNDGAPPLGELMSFDDAAWDKAWQQNFMSVVRLTRGAVPAMRAAGGGRIVNITALSVLQPMPKFGLSVATWAGVIGYAKTLSLEVAADNITVNTICPGRIATGRIAKVFGPGGTGAVADDETTAKLAKEVPVGRLGEPDEVAALVAMLASDAGGYITGSTLHVDGGRRANLL
jgi:3-oxoacyl-[acyl-carrier protein] reductase